LGLRALMMQAEPLHVGAAQVRALAEEFAEIHGRLPDTAELASRVDEWVGEELTVQAAYSLGLHLDDRVIRRRLARKMELLSDDPSATPDDLFEQALRLGLDRSDPIVRRRLVYLMEEFWTKPQPASGNKEAILDHERERLRSEREIVVESGVLEALKTELDL